jgi:hypothetical protein
MVSSVHSLVVADAGPKSASSATMTSRLSNVHRGVAFEHRSLQLLRNHLSMALERVGGKDDGGIDLIGWWWLPLSTASASTSGARSPSSTTGLALPRKRIRVLGQCKAEKKKLGPNYIREMEGVLHRHMFPAGVSALDRPLLPDSRISDHPTEPQPSTSPTTEPLIALVVSESAYSKATLLRALSSPVPFLLLHLPSESSPVTDGSSSKSSGDGEIGGAFWNTALSGSQGLLRGELDLRWERLPGASGRPGLWRHGGRVKSWIPEEYAAQPPS